MVVEIEKDVEIELGIAAWSLARAGAVEGDVDVDGC
jgi:hypothetical protein